MGSNAVLIARIKATAAPCSAFMNLTLPRPIPCSPETVPPKRSAGSAKAVVNCASQEYFTAVDLAVLEPKVITPIFKERKDGQEKEFPNQDFPLIELLLR